MQITESMAGKLVDISVKAGNAILRYYGREFSTTSKEDHSPLTEADLAAHHYIVDALQKLAPDIPVISEESGIPDYSERKKWRTFFLVDPLDGTKEFITRNGEFTVNIALIEGNAPIFGVVHIPASGITYYGGRGFGAFRMTRNNEKVPVSHHPFNKSRPATIAVSRSHGSDRTETELRDHGIEIGSRIVSGSSVKFCLVAEGTADLYPRLGPTMEWDTAAGDCIYRYSAAVKTASSGLVYNKENMTNGDFILGLDAV